MSYQYHFTWDPAKAIANREKHGVSFEQAATLFQDPLAVSVYDDEHSSDNEERWITLGQAENGERSSSWSIPSRRPATTLPRSG